jgi:hypothetical protein
MPTQEAQSFVGKVAHDASMAAAKVSIPAGAMLLGFTLNEWVAIATLVYIVLQSGYLAWKWARDYRASKRNAPLA